MKKIIALILALVTVLSLCAACGAKGGEGGPDGPGKDKTGADKTGITLTIGLPTNAMVLDYKNNALTKYLEEQTGYNLEFHVYSGGSDVATQISTTVAAQQKLPDIIFGITLGDGVISRYGEDEYFIDIAPYLEDRELSKVWWERLEENFSEYEQKDILRKMTEPESGAIYALPTMETSLVDTIDYQVWINRQWLDKLGLQAPTTLDELYTVLKAFKEQDPNGNGKADELPLFGSQSAGLSADVVNWLVNQFLYFNDRKGWNVDDSGKLYAPYTTNEYREAMKFIRKLIKEGLMQDSCFTTGSSDMKRITTPASGTALCGIFVGHLTLHSAYGNEVLYQYAPLAPLKGQNCVVNDSAFKRNIYITADCANPDAAWNLIMEMRKEESSTRIRYGEYGVNWKEAPEGAVSDYGIPAKIMIIEDPFNTQNTCMWSGATGTLNVWAEGEAAVMAEESSEWVKYRSKMAAESRKNFDEGLKNNPAVLCPTLVYTEAEKEATESVRTAVGDYWNKSRTDFGKGILDPNSDSDWNAYVANLNKLGLNEYLSLAQKAYDRQK